MKKEVEWDGVLTEHVLLIISFQTVRVKSQHSLPCLEETYISLPKQIYYSSN